MNFLWTCGPKILKNTCERVRLLVVSQASNLKFRPATPSQMFFQGFWPVFREKIICSFRKCALDFLDIFHFILHIVYIFKIASNVLTKFWYSDQMYRRDIFPPLCCISETSSHEQLTSTLFYILFANFMIWYQLEYYINDTFW